MPRSLDILRYLHENSPWLDPQSTVDTIKAGDPERAVTKAGVCWYACLDTMRAAHEAGCELLICHEPIYWDHLDRVPGPWVDKEPGSTRRRFLESTGLVILRAHDSWDQWPKVGIRDSWAQHLGFGEPIHVSEHGGEHACHAIYSLPRQPLRQLAAHIARRVRPLGEDSVQVMGEPDRMVSRPALGVGCIGPDAGMVDAGADVVVVCYDGAPYWAVRQRLFEQGAAVITVEHGSCEMPGLESMARHLGQVFPEIGFIYFDRHPKTWTVRGE